ncbi:MAG: hypothetical protein A2V98_23915 [Planctomycetes bacterium RBG_16_64_12]|nr:MAG: hypothetical protein A2V98_23915 [Planctomycetes bacterium RBG_16_64_12]
MADRAQEQLLGYLLGALGESERESIEDQLGQSPKLLRDLAQVRERLQPLWVAQPDFDPPPGLAARTCKFIASYPKCCANPGPEGAKKLQRHAPTPIPPMPAAVTGESSNSWSGLDLSVATGIVVAMSLLIFPAIQNSRFSSRTVECRDRLRQLGLALTQYSQTHDDYFPPVYDRGTFAGAGSYAPVLLGNELVDGSHWFVCPGSPLAEDRRFRVPSPDQLISASGEELVRLHSTMGGSYGYNLGFQQNGRYYSTRNLRRPYFALMADAPSTSLPGYQSLNHCGRGQNVLFEDGRVWFYGSSKPHVRADDVFVNESGMVDAGKHRNDSVIGASASVPHRTDAVKCGTEL